MANACPPHPLVLLGTALCTLLGAPLAAVDSDYGPVIAQPIVSGLNQPVFLTTPPHDSRHLFIVQKGGSIRIFDRETETLLSGAFLTVSPISTNSERGLLGMAFHPNFQTNRYVYTFFTDAGGASVLRRYTLESADPPFTAIPGSAHDLLTVAQPYANHNGGWIGFGPNDGYLYIALGDGGGSNDPHNHGQTRTTLLGAILRIDVDGDDFPGDPARNYAIPASNPFIGTEARPEIWAYGLRNPWRNSFDRQSGDLWIADVGQSHREEINFQADRSTGGENYGWRLREGTLATPSGGVGGPRPAGNVDPLHEYDFSDGNKAITGGYVYRGAAMPQLQGHYFFADFVADFVRSFPYDGVGSVNAADITDWTADFGGISNPVSFGEDAEGELYIISLNGHIYQMTQPPWYLWRNRYFSPEQIQDAAISGPHAMPLNDGIPNILKFAMGWDPLEPVGPMPFEVSVETFEGQRHLTLTINRSPEASDVALQIQSSGHLHLIDDWSNEDVVIITDEPDQLKVRDAIPLTESTSRFLRIKVAAEDSN